MFRAQEKMISWTWMYEIRPYICDLPETKFCPISKRKKGTIFLSLSTFGGCQTLFLRRYRGQISYFLTCFQKKMQYWDTQKTEWETSIFSSIDLCPVFPHSFVFEKIQNIYPLGCSWCNYVRKLIPRKVDFVKWLIVGFFIIGNAP